MQQSIHLSLNNLPQIWGEALSLQLADEENVLAWIETDLNTQLHFAEGIVVVTNKRLLTKMAADETWQEWRYQQSLLLTQRDYAGVGCLELFDAHARLACWRYRLGNDIAVSRLIGCFTQQLDYHLTGKLPLPAHTQAQCPNCAL